MKKSLNSNRILPFVKVQNRPYPRPPFSSPRKHSNAPKTERAIHPKQIHVENPGLLLRKLRRSRNSSTHNLTFVFADPNAKSKPNVTEIQDTPKFLCKTPEIPSQPESSTLCPGDTEEFTFVKHKESTSHHSLKACNTRKYSQVNLVSGTKQFREIFRAPQGRNSTKGLYRMKTCLPEIRQKDPVPNILLPHCIFDKRMEKAFGEDDIKENEEIFSKGIRCHSIARLAQYNPPKERRWEDKINTPQKTARQYRAEMTKELRSEPKWRLPKHI